MTDDEIGVLLRELETVARSVGLGSLVEQEQAMARSGEATEVLGDAREGRSKSRRAPNAPRKGEFRIMPFGAKHRLATLLDLVEAAVVGGELVEKAVQRSADNLVETETLTSGDVTFDIPSSDSPDLLTELGGAGKANTESGAWALQDHLSPSRENALSVVVDVIRQLRLRANLTKGDWLQEIVAEERSQGLWPQ